VLLSLTSWICDTPGRYNVAASERACPELVDWELTDLRISMTLESCSQRKLIFLFANCFASFPLM
jgi:hypothetical protein